LLHLNDKYIGDAMHALRRGLKGAMLGAGMACVVVFWGPVLYDIPWRTFIALAALAGLLVGSFGGVSACSPRNRMRVLAIIGAVTGFALLASPIMAMVLRSWKIELSGLSYLLPILAGLLGGVVAVVYEAGVTARSKHGDFENHTSKCRSIWGSLLGAGMLLFFDVAVEGSFLSSILACPIWFLISVVKNLILLPGWRLALSRAAIPVLTLGTVSGMAGS
jgi:hypothetical protein